MGKTILVLSALMLAAIPAFSGGSQETAAETLVYGTTEKITDFDPASAYDFHTWEIFHNIYQGLVTFAPGTTDLVPALAESWSSNDKGTIFTFKLRHGLRFADGTPFTATSVAWTVNRNRKLAGEPSWLITDYVGSVRALDNLTVEFALTSSVPYFPKLLSLPIYFPLNPNAYPFDKIVRNPSELRAGGATNLGPYRISSFNRDGDMVLEANPGFWGRQPRIKRIVIRSFPDSAALRAALENRDIDLAYKGMAPMDMAELEVNPSIAAHRFPGPFIRYISFETSESVFKDKRLRQAVAALVNRPEIVRDILPGQYGPLYSMVPNGMSLHTDNYKTVWGDGNVDAAEKILSGLGYSAEKPFEFDLWYTPTRYGDTESGVAEALKDQLEKTPLLKVTLKSAEWDVFKEQLQNKGMPAALLGWYPDHMDPDAYTAVFAATGDSQARGIHFSNKEWDSFFDMERTDISEPVRRSVFTRIQRLWTDENPTIPLFQGDLSVFAKKTVTEIKIGPPMILNYDRLMMPKQD